MSYTGVWSVGAVPDAEVVALPRRFAHLDETWTVPDGCADDLRWWLGGGDREPYFTPGPTAAAHRFAAFARGGGPTAPAVVAMREAATDLLGRAEADGTDPDGLFAVAVRKGEPATALLHGLGAEASAQLPGWFGDFLLTADEVRAVLPDAESVLDLTGPRRTEVLARVNAWAYAMTDAPEGEFDAAGLLAGPLRVLRYAAAHGLGVVAVTGAY
ncbi:hypothetical protein ACFUN8_11700 [Streptomyces sp. NPDC057307]|uniref:hypothetical protein n=1 Tax=Streptomyces sp. NPDC057307 TaxID=3346096 RepID=UPI003633E912